MDNKSDKIDSVKYTPILKRGYNQSGYQSTFEKLIFKKNILLERPKFNVIDKIYRKQSKESKKKPLLIDPIERKHVLVITTPILGKEKKQPRSASVIPKQKHKSAKFEKMQELALPVLNSVKNRKLL